MMQPIGEFISCPTQDSALRGMFNRRVLLGEESFTIGQKKPWNISKQFCFKRMPSNQTLGRSNAYSSRMKLVLYTNSL